MGSALRAAARLPPCRRCGGAVPCARSELRGRGQLDRREDVALAPGAEPLPALARPDTIGAASEPVVARAHGLIAAAQRPIAVIGSSAMRMRDPALLQSVI